VGGLCFGGGGGGGGVLVRNRYSKDLHDREEL